MRVFRIKISNEEQMGMNAISLVEHPAVEVDFLALSKEQSDLEFTSFNDEKKEITGVVCLADTPILRKNDRYGVYAIVFEKDAIKNMMLKYFKDGFSNKVNIEHKGNMIEGLTMIESYVKDTQRNIAPVEFSNVPDGSWLITFKVENDEVWKQIKEEHKLKGFSLQGRFDFEDMISFSYDTVEEEDYDTWLESIIK